MKFRQDDFTERYDGDTIFYDCIWVEKRRRALLMGPPLLNLKDAISKMRIVAMPSGSECGFTARELDRHSQIWVDTPQDTTGLSIQSELGSKSVSLAVGQVDVFKDKRVLFTINQDNRIEWICDWIRYHRDTQGANAVLIYDNSSTSYSVVELKDRILALAGMDAVKIVNWPFKFGPQGYSGKHWDSDYCQNGALEDARWKYLQNARSVLNADVDELIITKDKTIFELAETSSRKYVTYFGKWIIPLDDAEGNSLSGDGDVTASRHKDFQHALSLKRKWKLYRPVLENRCPTKWAAVPAECPDRSQWKTHRIAGILQPSLPLQRAGYRHFRRINTSWKYTRSLRDKFDSAKHQVDQDLIEAFRRTDWNS